MFYVPDLGAAPLWAKNVDTFVNELKLDAATGGNGFGDGYVFCSKEEVINLGLLNTEIVKPYLNGFYVPKSLINNN